ncbi:hypothetical protein BP6252_09465 [Coleophoma cylindrospora]|uniref:Uncharacterized protein n=1 Tax=Coleophoma cylindrospora TaxID=1849047 RepID=A0A3D8R207_9HELO|nr:hypothetical protein BP6252_09465 [Coleophoma cylindrospora]
MVSLSTQDSIGGQHLLDHELTEKRKESQNEKRRLISADDLFIPTPSRISSGTSPFSPTLQPAVSAVQRLHCRLKHLPTLEKASITQEPTRASTTQPCTAALCCAVLCFNGARQPSPRLQGQRRRPQQLPNTSTASSGARPATEAVEATRVLRTLHDSGTAEGKLRAASGQQAQHRIDRSPVQATAPLGNTLSPSYS